MVSAYLYIEGTSNEKGYKIGCREAFHKLIEKTRVNAPMPRMVASGSRSATFKRFQTAHHSSKGAFVAMLIDSEDPVIDGEKPWQHLKQLAEDKWDRPPGATDDQVLFMTTCMETWIVADRATLKSHYVKNFKESALPPLDNLENRHRHDVQDKLSHATRDCSNAYAKGKRSFEVLAILDFEPLMKLPSFARMVRILKEKL